MRHGRAKAARKTLKFFKLNAGINPPYDILIDGNFLVAAVKNKMNLFERLGRVLQNEKFNAFVARAALNELALLPGEAFHRARLLGSDECVILEEGGTGDEENAGDQKRPVPSAREEMIRLLATSNPRLKRKFFLATQDEELADEVRTTHPNVPLLRISQSVLLLEAPSSSSRRHALSVERGKQSAAWGGMMTAEERRVVQSVKKRDWKDREEESRRRAAQEAVSRGKVRVKAKAKGPNPLSCKKKQKRALDDGSDAALKQGSGGKRKRRRRTR